MIRKPYLLFLGDAPDQLAAKVAQGIADWRPEHVVGQLRLDGCKADAGVPDLSLSDAWEQGARTLVVGVANRGGIIPEAWLDVLKDALEIGFDLANGQHNLLRDQDILREVAQRNERSLHDVRIPTVAYPIANGRKRTGKRCLALGTDCSIGKMYTGLAMDREMRTRGMKSTFRPTGQTGILITGSGVPLDAVVADFMAGAVEFLTPVNDSDHWDHIEGQGSLFHVSYSGVTMALIHGGQPDAIILAHEPTRTHMRGLPHHGLPTLEELREVALPMAQVANPAVRICGVSMNTSALDDDEATRSCEEIEERMGLPTVDPFRHGAARLVDALEAI